MIRLRVLLVATVLLGALSLHALPTHCDVCGGNFGATVITKTDEVDGTKKWLCEPCADLTTVCYRCGVPVWKDYLTLSDGRVLCKRDQVGVVLNEAEALAVCLDVNSTMASVFGRYTTFPSTNVQVRLADRVDVRALVGVAGYDFSCPNLLGYTLSLQKPGHQWHDIRLLTGLQKGVLQATYAHELAHAWISENLSKARELDLKGDAAEGFCELIGYQIAEAYRDETAKNHVLANQYTRGQVLLFIEAARRFGLVDVFDWMNYGQTTLLNAEHLDEIRDVQLPARQLSKPVSEILFIPTTRPQPRESLELTSIIVGPTRSIATINGRAFEVNEERKVPLGATNVVLRCLSIEKNSVLVEQVGTGGQQRLTLRSSTPSATQ